MWTNPEGRDPSPTPLSESYDGSDCSEFSKRKSEADLWEGPGGARRVPPTPLYRVKKKKNSQKEEKPAGANNLHLNLPPTPP